MFCCPGSIKLYHGYASPQADPSFSAYGVLAAVSSCGFRCLSNLGCDSCLSNLGCDSSAGSLFCKALAL
ncbi:hypothetical protein HanIR_Chr13g0632591 [Helianthus annuus]|nr:hypothetical protein HanIR_Chr13g0632591 [Helianthus annuus]